MLASVQFSFYTYIFKISPVEIIKEQTFRKVYPGISSSKSHKIFDFQNDFYGNTVGFCFASIIQRSIKYFTALHLPVSIVERSEPIFDYDWFLEKFDMPI